MAKLVCATITSGYAAVAALNANFDAIEAAMENTLSRDGTSPNAMAANLDMNSNKVINLAQPTNAADAVRYQDLQDAQGLAATFPSQTGNAGRVLKTDGSVVSWVAISAQLASDLSAAADKLPYFSGASTWSLADFSAFARTLLDDATAAAARTTLDVPSNADLALKAPLASPTFTGTPAAPTAAADTNTTQLATTAFVLGQAATQAEQETASSTSKTVTPGRQHFHPSAAKCWGHASVSGGVPTLDASYNITSITDTAVGRLAVTIANDFSSANYAAVATIEQSSTSCNATFTDTLAAGSFNIRASSASNAGGAASLFDPVSWSWAAFGDQ